jgi:hypothetical protein
MVEKQETCCEELGERQPRKETVEYGSEEPSVPSPGKPMVTHMSEVKPERKKMSVMTKLIIVFVMVAVLLCISTYVMYFT